MYRRTFLSVGLTAVGALNSSRKRNAVRTQAANDVRRLIDGYNAQIVHAFTTADAGAIVDLFAPDGMIVLGTACYSGTAAIRERMTTVFAQTGPAKEVVIEILALTLDGDLAYESGSWRYSYPEKAGVPLSLSGRYLVVWRRQAERIWRIYRDLRLPGAA